MSSTNSHMAVGGSRETAYAEAYEEVSSLVEEGARREVVGGFSAKTYEICHPVRDKHWRMHYGQ